MIRFVNSNTLQTLYGSTKTPGSRSPSTNRKFVPLPVSTPPAYLGFGRPAQSSAGQP